MIVEDHGSGDLYSPVRWCMSTLGWSSLGDERRRRQIDWCVSTTGPVRIYKEGTTRVDVSRNRVDLYEKHIGHSKNKMQKEVVRR